MATIPVSETESTWSRRFDDDDAAADGVAFDVKPASLRHRGQFDDDADAGWKMGQVFTETLIQTCMRVGSRVGWFNTHVKRGQLDNYPSYYVICSPSERACIYLLRKGKYHCTADLLFDWSGSKCVAYTYNMSKAVECKQIKQEVSHSRYKWYFPLDTVKNIQF